MVAREFRTLAERVNGYYEAELVYGPTHQRPWRTVEEVELGTLTWVYWHNHERLHGYLGDIPPAEYENTIYADETTSNQLAGIK